MSLTGRPLGELHDVPDTFGGPVDGPESGS